MPPLFVQEACWRYNKMKRSELDNDPYVVDFCRGLSEGQKESLRPAGSIHASSITTACQVFWQEALGEEMPPTSIQDADIYEHSDFPGIFTPSQPIPHPQTNVLGLQIIPQLLPLSAQILFVSQVMHTNLANPSHKTNLATDYDLTYPSSNPPYRSLFTYGPTNTHAVPKTPATPPLNMSQYLSRKLRWLTLGTQYDWPTRSYPRTSATPFHAPLSRLVTSLFPHIRPESGVCLLYGSKDLMPVHRDVSEQCQRALASFSFGCDGIFVLARGNEDVEDEEEKRRRVLVIRVRSGDCVHLDGEARWAWHAMPRTIAGTAPKGLAEWPVGTQGEGVTEAERRAYEKWKGYMGSKRLNVSCRQVWD